MAAPPNARVLQAELMPLHEQARLRQIFSGIEGAATGLSVEEQIKFLERSTRLPPSISRKRPSAAAGAGAGAEAAAAVTTTEDDNGDGVATAIIATAIEAPGVPMSSGDRPTVAAPRAIARTAQV